jgi:hypothetical protein
MAHNWPSTSGLNRTKAIGMSDEAMDDEAGSSGRILVDDDPSVRAWSSTI